MARGGSRARLHVAMVHSYYTQANPSGENVTVDAQVEALRAVGVEVSLVRIDTDDVRSEMGYGVRSAGRVATGLGRSPLRELRALQPDVVHVHNLFPNWGTRWVRHLDRPLVATVHNFRSVCAAGTLFRDGHVCEACPRGDRWAGLRHGCYRDRRVTTLPVAMAQRTNPSDDPVLRRASAIVVPSQATAEWFAAQGIQRSRLHVVQGFVPHADAGTTRPSVAGPDAAFVYVGRLSEEKGIRRLVERWPPGLRLRVIGDGPQFDDIAALAGPGVEMAGRVARRQVVEELRQAVALLVPSLWYETFGLGYVEALSVGTPVVAWRPNIVADRVSRDGTGLAVDWDADLGRVLRELRTQRPALSQTAVEQFEAHYTEAAATEALIDVYRHVTGRGPGTDPLSTPGRAPGEGGS